MKNKLYLLILGMFMIIILNLFLVSAWNFEGRAGSVLTTTGNLTRFTELIDTPASYTGGGGDCVKVNVGETGVEFSACGSITETDPAWTGNYSTFEGLIDNQTYMRTDNSTYDDYSLNVSTNWTERTFGIYGEWWYNQTQAIFAEPLLNATIDARATQNTTFNETHTDLLYSGIEWDYNQTTPATAYADANMSVAVLQSILNDTEIYSTYNATYEANEGNLSWNESHTNTLYVRNNTSGWYLNITKLWTTMFHTLTSNFEWTVTDDGSDMFMDFSEIGGVNSLFIETAGTFMEMVANPGPANDYEMFAFEETQGADTAINFYEGGAGHNRIWSSGSVRVGGGKDSSCSNLTTEVDCDTSGTGADFVVQDDLWVGGKIFAFDWTNATISIFNKTYDDYALNVSTNWTQQSYDLWNTIWVADEDTVFDNLNVCYLNQTNSFTEDTNFTDNDITDISYIKLHDIGGACDLSVSGYICMNETGTYIVG